MSMRATQVFWIEKTPRLGQGIRDCQCRKCGRQFRGHTRFRRVCNHSAKCPGRVWCAAVGDVCFDAGQGGGWINIKRRHGPFGNGFGGFFDELQDAVVCAQQDIAPAFAVIVVGIVAHGDVRRGIGFECVDEILQGKPQDVVRRENDHIVGNGACFNGKEEIAHRAQAVVVGGRAVIQNFNGQMRFALCACPIRKVVVKSAVGHQIRAVNVRNGFELIDEVVENGFATHFEQGLGKIFGEGIQPRGISRRENNGFHRILAPSSG